MPALIVGCIFIAVAIICAALFIGGLVRDVFNYYMDRKRKTDAWNDEQAEYAKAKARVEWEEIIRRQTGEG
jgi:uncharacterized protein YxeA